MGSNSGERTSLKLSLAGRELLDAQGLRKELQVDTYVEREPLKSFKKWLRGEIPALVCQTRKRHQLQTSARPRSIESSLPILALHCPSSMLAGVGLGVSYK